MDVKRVSGNNSTALPVTSQYGGWNKNGKYSCISTLHLTCSSACHPVQLCTHLQEKKSRPRNFNASAAVKPQQYRSGNLCSSLKHQLPWDGVVQRPTGMPETYEEVYEIKLSLQQFKMLFAFCTPTLSWAYGGFPQWLHYHSVSQCNVCLGPLAFKNFYFQV